MRLGLRRLFTFFTHFLILVIIILSGTLLYITSIDTLLYLFLCFPLYVLLLELKSPVLLPNTQVFKVVLRLVDAPYVEICRLQVIATFEPLYHEWKVLDIFKRWCDMRMPIGPFAKDIDQF